MSEGGFREKFRRIIDGNAELHIQRKKHRMKFITICGFHWMRMENWMTIQNHYIVIISS